VIDTIIAQEDNYFHIYALHIGMWQTGRHKGIKLRLVCY